VVIFLLFRISYSESIVIEFRLLSSERLLSSGVTIHSVLLGYSFVSRYKVTHSCIRLMFSCIRSMSYIGWLQIWYYYGLVLWGLHLVLGCGYTFVWFTVPEFRSLVLQFTYYCKTYSWCHTYCYKTYWYLYY